VLEANDIVLDHASARVPPPVQSDDSSLTMSNTDWINGANPKIRQRFCQPTLNDFGRGNENLAAVKAHSSALAIPSQNDVVTALLKAKEGA